MRHTRTPTGARFYMMLALAAVATFLLHEAAHWAMGTALGHAMVMGLNGAATVERGLDSFSDVLLIAAAGPALTLLQGAAAYALIVTRGWLLAYPFLFTAWFMRFAAALVSFVHPNDEARIGMLLGLGTWPLPAIVVLALLALTWLGSRRLRLGFLANLACFAFCSLVFAAIVLADGRW